MECLIHLMALCVFDPSNVYATAEVLTPVNDAHRDGEGRWCRNRWCPGPVGALTVGMRVALTEGWELHYGLRHESMLLISNDRGQESVFMQLTWRPFR